MLLGAEYSVLLIDEREQEGCKNHEKFGHKKIKKILQENTSYRILYYIGLGGFEPPTPCPPDMYAKPLRYSPNSIGYPTGRNITMKGFLCQ